MYQETRKMHLIEEVLKVSNEETLAELETVLIKSKSGKKRKNQHSEFRGRVKQERNLTNEKGHRRKL